MYADVLKRCASVAIVLLLGACAHSAQRYGLSADNLVTLQQLKATTGTTIQAANFTSFQPGLNSIMCRAAGPVEAPDQKPFEAYLRDALISELKVAGLYNENSVTVLNGYLEHIDFSSAIGSGSWTIRMRFNKAGGTPFPVENTYSFSTNFVADIACSQVAQALGPATQDFLKKTFDHPSFREMFRQR